MQFGAITNEKDLIGFGYEDAEIDKQKYQCSDFSKDRMY